MSEISDKARGIYAGHRMYCLKELSNYLFHLLYSFPSLYTTAVISYTLQNAKSIFVFQARPGVCD